MFWGLIMEPQRRYTQVVKKAFHISMAALDISTSNDEPAQVMCGFEGRNYLLCTLRKPNMLQSPLDLNFDVGTEVSFATNGKCHVHLTGYLANDLEGDLNEEQEEEEEEEECLEPLIVGKSSKRQRSKALNGPPVKKVKSESSDFITSTQQTNEDEDDDDDDSEDSDVDMSQLLLEDSDVSEEEEEDEDNEAEEDSDEEEEGEEEEDDEDDEDEDDDGDLSSLSGEEEEEIFKQTKSKTKLNGDVKKKPIAEEKTPSKQKDKQKNKENKKPKSPVKEQKKEQGKLGKEQQTPGKDQRKSLGKEQKTPSKENKTPGKEQNKTPGKDQNKTPKKEQNKTPGKEQNKTPGKEQSKTPGKEQGKSPKKRVVQGGVIIEDIRDGSGDAAKNGKFVHVFYEGRFKDNNKMFDSTTKGPGFGFRLGKGEVIKGWDVGVNGMKAGGKRRITCPPAMAYGQKGCPPEIPPNSTLVFEVELKKVG